MELYKNNKHFQGFSKESADRWGPTSFLDTEAGLEEKGECGFHPLGNCAPPLPGKEPGGAMNLEHPVVSAPLS